MRDAVRSGPRLSGGDVTDAGDLRFAARALDRYQLTRPSLRLVATSFNAVYRVDAAEGAFMLRVGPAQRIHAPGSADAEAAWTAQIGAAGIGAPRVLRTADGRSAVTDAAIPGRTAQLLTWIEGSPVASPLTAPRITEIGALLALLHEASPPVWARPAGVLDAGTPTVFEVPNLLDAAPMQQRALFRRHEALAIRELEELRASASESRRVLHFDLTPRNVVVTPKGSLAAIDHQDIAWGFPIQDIANALYGITRGRVDDEAIALLRSGYQRHAVWPHADERRLPRLMIVRRLAMINLALVLARPGLHDYLARNAVELTAEGIAPPRPS